ncbi:recombination regulator RecX [Mycoavidus sp. SF9855]|uniref:recombination regulator RecX n=1 Tax=Mycoavidus sp. SF9855 TaxID=2968475 RepID=UPI00211CA0D1|nr:recombination regulator RecX [Mycoavidus sp. SF9855]UUM21893.1 recombination regulator RecX [Mycoavidus sp. SF9855]
MMRANPSLKGRALGYLSRREYSRVELQRKLSSYTDSEADVDALLNTLQHEGWLSDTRFAESVARRRAARCGTHRIIHELKQHVLDEELIERIGTELQETEFSRAKAVWEKKYGVLPATHVERARQARFLMMRGFANAIIVRLLGGCDED